MNFTFILYLICYIIISNSNLFASSINQQKNINDPLLEDTVFLYNQTLESDRIIQLYTNNTVLIIDSCTIQNELRIISNDTISNNLQIFNSHFLDNVIFEDCILSGSILFESSEYDKCLGFYNCIIFTTDSLNVNQKDSCFQCPDSSTVNKIEVTNCQIKDRLDILYSDISVDMEINHTDIDSSCLFVQTKFSGDSYFHGLSSPLGVTIMGGGFSNRARFSPFCEIPNSYFSDCDLSKVEFGHCTVDSSFFEPEKIPQSRNIFQPYGMESWTYGENPSALIELREQFKRDGFRRQERCLTCALKRTENNQENSGFVYCLNYVLFDFTCHYGLAFVRPLILFLLLGLFTFCFYWIVLRFERLGTVWIIRRGIDGEIESKFLICDLTKKFHYSQRIRKEVIILVYAMLLSIMSGFNIGFRDFNFGKWLKRILPYDLELRPIGTVRVLSGIQSVISVYLIALFLLTYFGRPFG